MSYTYTQREECLEDMAARAISEGAAFADAYARLGPILKSFHRRSMPHTLSRLSCGEVLDVRDDDCICAIGEALVSAANQISAGYGNRVLNERTHEDILFNQTLDELRWLILRWQSFVRVRGQVSVKLAARRLIPEIGKNC